MKKLIIILTLITSVANTEIFEIPNIRPFDDTVYKVEISGKFGSSRIHAIGGHEYPHTGIDYKLAKGTVQWATAKGRVRFAEDSETGYGNLVIIDHGNGYETYYAHLLRIDVKEGDMVIKKQQIGKVGKSGRSFGYHAHYEVRYKGKPIHPAAVIF